jgi:hypothetical protein
MNRKEFGMKQPWPYRGIMPEYAGKTSIWIAGVPTKIRIQRLQNNSRALHVDQLLLLSLLEIRFNIIATSHLDL